MFVPCPASVQANWFREVHFMNTGGQSRVHAAPLPVAERGQEGWWLLDKAVANEVLLVVRQFLDVPKHAGEARTASRACHEA